MRKFEKVRLYLLSIRKLKRLAKCAEQLFPRNCSLNFNIEPSQELP